MPSGGWGYYGTEMMLLGGGIIGTTRIHIKIIILEGKLFRQIIYFNLDQILIWNSICLHN